LARFLRRRGRPRGGGRPPPPRRPQRRSPPSPQARGFLRPYGHGPEPCALDQLGHRVVSLGTGGRECCSSTPTGARGFGSSSTCDDDGPAAAAAPPGGAAPPLADTDLNRAPWTSSATASGRLCPADETGSSHSPTGMRGFGSSSCGSAPPPAPPPAAQPPLPPRPEGHGPEPCALDQLSHRVVPLGTGSRGCFLCTPTGVPSFGASRATTTAAAAPPPPPPPAAQPLTDTDLNRAPWTSSATASCRFVPAVESVYAVPRQGRAVLARRRATTTAPPPPPPPPGGAAPPPTHTHAPEDTDLNRAP
jgi:hypothetical protein